MRMRSVVSRSRARRRARWLRDRPSGGCRLCTVRTTGLRVTARRRANSAVSACRTARPEGRWPPTRSSGQCTWKTSNRPKMARGQLKTLSLTPEASCNPLQSMTLYGFVVGRGRRDACITTRSPAICSPSVRLPLVLGNGNGRDPSASPCRRVKPAADGLRDGPTRLGSAGRPQERGARVENGPDEHERAAEGAGFGPRAPSRRDPGGGGRAGRGGRRSRAGTRSRRRGRRCRGGPVNVGHARRRTVTKRSDPGRDR